MQDPTGRARPAPGGVRPALEYAPAFPEADAGPGIGTIVCDFVWGSAAVSLVGYVLLACFTLSQKGGMGLEGIVLIAALVGLVLLNVAMAGAVYVGASKKRTLLKCPVAVRPRWRMVVAGVLAPVIGIPVALFASSVIPALGVPLPGLGIPVFVALASVPAGFAAWSLAGPSDHGNA